MTTYTITEAQRQQLLDVCLAGVSTANMLATRLLQSLPPQAAPSTSPAVVRVCPDKNSVCGYNSRYWCNSCPKHTDAAPSTSPKPIYQYQLTNGNWIDQPKDMYDYIATLGQATVRELFTHPAPSNYDQQAMELCNVCGWKGIFPGEDCLVCAKSAPSCATPKAAPSTSQPLTPHEIGAFVGTHEFGPEQLKWFRLGEAAHGIKGGA